MREAVQVARCLLPLLLVASCNKAPPEPSAARPAAKPKPSAAPASSLPPGQTYVPRKPFRLRSGVEPAPDDPLQGDFSIDDATVGLPGKGPLIATIETDLGALTCSLYDDRAPYTVANFIGLARGIRPWKDPSGQWVKKPLYDGTSFHRVLKKVWIQGGDPKGDGTGGPGYAIVDENWPGANHNRADLLCMASRGPSTSGSQFFITTAPAPKIDRMKSHTVFGECGPDELIQKIAGLELKGDKPVTPPVIKTIRIKRGD
jgi:peptidyl-prolyl cis-trans isomerase A (cyclophilin A)